MSETIGDGVNIERLLSAIRTQEVTNCSLGGLRFEASWMPRGARFAVQGKLVVGTGRNYDRSGPAQARWAEHGIWSCASYGPWQMLYHTAADMGYDGHPAHLNDESIAKWWATRLLQRIEARGAQSVRQFADAWNTGNHRDDYHNKEYEDNIVRYYEEATHG